MSLSTTFLFFFLILRLAQMNYYVVVPLFFSGEMYLITGNTGLQALFSLFLFSIFMYIINDLSDFLADLNLQPHVVFLYESTHLIYHFSRCFTLSGRRSKTVSSSIGLPATSSQFSSCICKTGPMSLIWFPLMVRTFIMGRSYNTLISST